MVTPRLARLVRILLRRPKVLRFSLWRTFGSVPDGDDGAPAALTRAPPFARRPLSPLERVSQMLPQESLSQEIQDLRGDRPKQGDGGSSIPTSTEDDEDPDTEIFDGNPEDAESSLREERMPASPIVPTERALRFGEILLAEYRRKRRLELQKMFQLEEGAKLMSNHGAIAHEAMEGCHSGTILRTSQGLPILIRRPSLEEFTLFMKRGPAIAYPKVSSSNNLEILMS